MIGVMIYFKKTFIMRTVIILNELKKLLKENVAFNTFEKEYFMILFQLSLSVQKDVGICCSISDFFEKYKPNDHAEEKRIILLFSLLLKNHFNGTRKRKSQN